MLNGDAFLEEDDQDKVVEYASEHYQIAPVQTIGKINALYKAAANLNLGKVTGECKFAG